MIRSNLILYVLVLFTIACSGGKVKMPDETSKSTSEETLVEANRVLVKKDKQRIARYVERMGWQMKETETGLWYEILEPGTGDSVTAGERVSVEYTISLLDGTVCYSSKDDGLKEFTVGRGRVESGLEQGILLCREQTKARFIMPPYLAYGLPGDGSRIPARAIIIYEIKVNSISKTN